MQIRIGGQVLVSVPLMVLECASLRSARGPVGIHNSVPALLAASGLGSAPGLYLFLILSLPPNSSLRSLAAHSSSPTGQK